MHKNRYFFGGDSPIPSHSRIKKHSLSFSFLSFIKQDTLNNKQYSYLSLLYRSHRALSVNNKQFLYQSTRKRSHNTEDGQRGGKIRYVCVKLFGPKDNCTGKTQNLTSSPLQVKEGVVTTRKMWTPNVPSGRCHVGVMKDKKLKLMEH